LNETTTTLASNQGMLKRGQEFLSRNGVIDWNPTISELLLLIIFVRHYNIILKNDFLCSTFVNSLFTRTINGSIGNSDLCNYVVDMGLEYQSPYVNKQYNSQMIKLIDAMPLYSLTQFKLYNKVNFIKWSEWNEAIIFAIAYLSEVNFTCWNILSKSEINK
jgi:hypothetical protein